VAGALAERCQMAAYLCYSFFLTGFVYPVVVHAVWSPAGFLSTGNSSPLLNIGMVDFAGSSVVHMVGGTTALISTYLLGSRRGRFYDLQTGEPLEVPKPMPGHSVSLQMLGSFILWFGWFGFNPGKQEWKRNERNLYREGRGTSMESMLVSVRDKESRRKKCVWVVPAPSNNMFFSIIIIGSALLLGDNPYKSKVAALCAVNTFLASSAACISALFGRFITTKIKTGDSNYDLLASMNGTLAGLVAVTAGCGTIEPWAALIVGIVAGILYLWSSDLLVYLKLDDVVDAVPVHFVNGLWGCLATGLFSEPERMRQAVGTELYPGFFYSLSRGQVSGHLLGCQVIGILFVIGWTTAMMTPFFLGLNALGWLRSEAVEELVGLDVCYNGEEIGADIGSNAGSDADGARNDFMDAYEEYRLAQRKNTKAGAAAFLTTSKHKQINLNAQGSQRNLHEANPFNNAPAAVPQNHTDSSNSDDVQVRHDDQYFDETTSV